MLKYLIADLIYEHSPCLGFTLSFLIEKRGAAAVMPLQALPAAHPCIGTHPRRCPRGPNSASHRQASNSFLELLFTQLFETLQATREADAHHWCRAWRLSCPAAWGRFQCAFCWKRLCHAQAGGPGKQSPIAGSFTLRSHPRHLPSAPLHQLHCTMPHADPQGESKPCFNTR